MKYLVPVVRHQPTFDRRCGNFFRRESGSKYGTSPINLSSINDISFKGVGRRGKEGEMDTVCNFSTNWISDFVELDFKVLSL